MEATGRKMTAERVCEAARILMKYKAGKANLERRVRETEEWWKQRQGTAGKVPYGSAWLFNSVINRHADAIAMYPAANILPREPGDKELCAQLSQLIPCVLEQNDFEETYSRVMWQKMKQGTGIYGVFWDPERSEGAGDIAVKRIDVMNLFWEPGIGDIQESKHVFLVTPMERDAVRAMAPAGDERWDARAITLTEYPYDDHVDRGDRVPVVDWYYHVTENGVRKLHYCRFAGETVLYASEDDTRPVTERRGVTIGTRMDTGEAVTRDIEVETGPSVAEEGWYRHQLYPFVMDPLFPVEGSPCGFGYVDVGKSAQAQIDLLNRAIMQNALCAATPRYFVREDGGINEAEFADLSKPFVHVNANLGEDTIRRIGAESLHSNYIAILNNKITELKETSNNIDSSNGITNGVTAASGIAAQQEAAGKTSRAATMSAYRAYGKVVRMILALMAQFYDARRVFRVFGADGGMDFVGFDNSAMRAQAGGDAYDVKVTAQSKTVYTRDAQNQLAVSLANLGVFDPGNTDRALLLLSSMDFDGKEEVERKVAQAGTTAQLYAQLARIALELAQRYEPETAEALSAILNDRARVYDTALKIGGAPKLSRHSETGMISRAEDRRMRAARARAVNAAGDAAAK